MGLSFNEGLSEQGTGGETGVSSWQTTSATFAMAPEVGFIMDFDVDKGTNLPTGCGPLDFPSKGVDHSGKKGATSTPFYPGSPIVYQAGY